MSSPIARISKRSAAPALTKDAIKSLGKNLAVYNRALNRMSANLYSSGANSSIDLPAVTLKDGTQVPAVKIGRSELTSLQAQFNEVP